MTQFDQKTSAYGPQENNSRVKKDNFWKYLEEDVNREKIEGKGYILQGDLNAWLGKNVIQNDPRPQNTKGKCMEDFLKLNQLRVVNGLELN